MVFAKGHTINVGRICTKESRLNISMSLTGKKRSPLSEEHKKKIGDSNKGRRYAEEDKKHMSLGRIGMKFDDAHKKNISLSHKGILSGNKHPNWKGGKTPDYRILRHTDNYISWRKKIFEKDNYTCQHKNCEFCHNDKGTVLHPHHIKSFSKFKELRFDINNGITYCIGYHLKGGIHKKVGE